MRTFQVSRPAAAGATACDGRNRRTLATHRLLGRVRVLKSVIMLIRNPSVELA